MKQTLYISSYTTYPPADGTSTEGLYVYQMDDESGHLERIHVLDAGQNPAFMAMSSGRNRLYIGNESGDGEVTALAIRPSQGEVRFLNRQKVQGADPCYVSLDPSERWLLVACYSSGSLSVFPLYTHGELGALADRVQHEGSGPNKERQDKAHAHCIRFDPSGRFVLAVDLGKDQVFVYRLDLETGKLTANQPDGFHMHPGAGPRHLAYHPSGRFIYISNELDSTVTACTWDSEAGVLHELQSLTALPEGFTGENTAADIHVTPNGKFLYISNRGDNSLAAFKVNGHSGKLTPIGRFSCGGNWPRNFAIDPTGRFLLVANQKSCDAAVFRIGEDGNLTQVWHEPSLVAPVCVVFA